MNPIESLTIVRFSKCVFFRQRQHILTIQVLKAVNLFPHFLSLKSCHSTARHQLFIRVCGLFSQSEKANLFRALEGFIKLNVLQDLVVTRFKVKVFHYTDLRTFSHRDDACFWKYSTTASGVEVLVLNRTTSIGTRGCPMSADTNSTSCEK